MRLKENAECLKHTPTYRKLSPITKYFKKKKKKGQAKLVQIYEHKMRWDAHVIDKAHA